MNGSSRGRLDELYYTNSKIKSEANRIATRAFIMRPFIINVPISPCLRETWQFPIHTYNPLFAFRFTSDSY